MINTTPTYKRYKKTSVPALQLNETVYLHGASTFSQGKIIGFQGKKAIAQFGERRYQVPIYLSKPVEAVAGMYPKYITRYAKDIPSRCRKNDIYYKEELLIRKNFRVLFSELYNYKNLPIDQLTNLNNDLTQLLTKYELS